eukprot:11856405-Heterocapsa_arctica.AAC.1
MAPGTCTVEGMNNSAAYLDPMAPTSTCSTRNTLDWFMVSGGLAIAAETRVDPDTHSLTLSSPTQNRRQAQRRYGIENQKTQRISRTCQERSK